MEIWIGCVWWGVPWGLLGISQRGALGVAQLAVLGGVPLISALLIGLNAALSDLGREKTRAVRLAAALCASWLGLVFAGLPVAEATRPRASSGAAIDLLIVQPNLPRGERWGDALQPLNLYRVRAFADRALADEPPGIAALVLPENLLTARVDASRIARRVGQLARRSDSDRARDVARSGGSRSLPQLGDLARTRARHHRAARQGARDPAARVEPAIPRRRVARAPVRSRGGVEESRGGSEPSRLRRAGLRGAVALLRDVVSRHRRAAEDI
jgi:hypothetical protein